MSVYASYWDCRPDDAPAVTGAISVMDCTDLIPVLRALEIDFSKSSVLDVGCGTGRLAQLVGGQYMGLDVSPGCVQHARSRGLKADTIKGPEDLERYQGFDWTTCLSVFTHIPRGERLEYLKAFESPDVLVDIIPGDGGGNIPRWTADRRVFEMDIEEAGYRIDSAYQPAPAPSGETHIYFRLERA